MRNRFVIGAIVDSGSTAQTNITGANTQTGGTKDAVVVAHNHGVTDPGHSHEINYFQGVPYTPPFVWATAEQSGGYGAQPTMKSNTTGITINSVGESGTNKNLPPYYALAFIMRIS